jgi:hypothetical protein
LRRFADNDRIHVFGKIDSRAFITCVRNVAGEVDFNVIPAVEEALAGVSATHWNIHTYIRQAMAIKVGRPRLFGFATAPSDRLCDMRYNV